MEERGKKKTSKKPEVSGSETALAEGTKIVEPEGSRRDREQTVETLTASQSLAPFSRIELEVEERISSNPIQGRGWSA